MIGIPEYWIAFVEEEPLTNANIDIVEDDAILGEMNKFHPGLVVKNDDYIPIGGCLTGSGDPYFFNIE